MIYIFSLIMTGTPEFFNIGNILFYGMAKYHESNIVLISISVVRFKQHLCAGVG